MIAFLRGAVLEKHPNLVIVDVNGVGYELTIPVSTFTALPDVGGTVKLRVYTQVREDAIALFGFHTADEKALFEKLILVSGIGPKLAVTVLSGLAAPDLVAAIRNGDLQTLVRVPGIGKKTAERMVLELKDKLDFAPATNAGGWGREAEVGVLGRRRGRHFGAVEYRRQPAVGRGRGAQSQAAGNRAGGVRGSVPYCVAAAAVAPQSRVSVGGVVLLHVLRRSRRSTPCPWSRRR